MCFHYANRYGLSKVRFETPGRNILPLILKGRAIHVAWKRSSTEGNILVLFDHDVFWTRVGLVSASRDCWPDIGDEQLV
jgi:hypothetical protein